MKSLAKGILVVVLVLGTSSIYAVGDVKIEPISGVKKARISVTPYNNEKVELKIFNENGTEFLYSEDFSEGTEYNKIYDFSKLDDGTYRIVAESDSKIIEKDIIVTNKYITVAGENQQYKPYFKLDNDKLIVSYLNAEDNGVSIDFYDGRETFFSDKKIKGLDIMKAYDLTDLKQGDYIVSLNSGKDSYSYHFQVK